MRCSHHFVCQTQAPLGLVSSVLEPDFDLGLGEAEHSGELSSLVPGEILLMLEATLERSDLRLSKGGSRALLLLMLPARGAAQLLLLLLLMTLMVIVRFARWVAMLGVAVEKMVAGAHESVIVKLLMLHRRRRAYSSCRKGFRLDRCLLLARSASSHHPSSSAAVVRMTALLVAQARRLKRKVMGVMRGEGERGWRGQERSMMVARRYTSSSAPRAAQLGHFGEEGIVGVDVGGVVLPPCTQQHRLGGQRALLAASNARRRRRG